MKNGTILDFLFDFDNKRQSILKENDNIIMKIVWMLRRYALLGGTQYGKCNYRINI